MALGVSGEAPNRSRSIPLATSSRCREEKGEQEKKREEINTHIRDNGAYPRAGTCDPRRKSARWKRCECEEESGGEEERENVREKRGRKEKEKQAK